MAVRDVNAIQNLTRAPHIAATPELVTPIGIAIAAQKSPIHYMSIKVNEQVVRLFELKEMTVGDAFWLRTSEQNNYMESQDMVCRLQ